MSNSVYDKTRFWITIKNLLLKHITQNKMIGRGRMIIWENKYPIILIWKVYKFEKIQTPMKYNFVWADTNLAWYIYQNSIWTAKSDSKYNIVDEEEDDVFIRLFQN